LTKGRTDEPVFRTTSQRVGDGGAAHHVILSRELGARGHYPAIDVLSSVSRLAGRVSSPQQREAARKIREGLAAYRQSEDLINLGAYVAGSNGSLDSAIQLRPQLLNFLRQDAEVTETLDRTLQQLYALAGQTV
jgi:flagellum-specific ATP synthase